MSVDTVEPAVAKAHVFSGTTSWLHLIRNAGPFSWAVGIALIGVVIGLISSGTQYFDWSYALVDAIFALGCGIAISWGGVPAFGQGLYFAAGGYAAAMLVPFDLPSGVTLLAGAVVAGLLAFLFSIVTLRTGFAAFALLSLVAAEACNRIIYTVPALGGENGLYGVARPSFFGWSMGGNAEFYFYCLFMLVLLVLFGRLLYQSTTGRSIRAARDDALRAQALGTSVARTRVTAFTSAGVVCGIAGVLYAQLQGVVDPSMGGFLQSTVGVMMVVLGGLGTFLGAVLGGVIYRWLELFAQGYTDAPDIWLGGVFIVVVLLTPVVPRAISRFRRNSATRAALKKEELL